MAPASNIVVAAVAADGDVGIATARCCTYSNSIERGTQMMILCWEL